MTNNFDYNAARKLIEDNTNVTEANPIKELFQICVKLFLIIMLVYFSLYFSSGIIINSLSLEQQIRLENVLSDINKIKTKTLTEEETERFNNVKSLIIQSDKLFPNTSNLNIYIIEDSRLNALCFPNGNIYITSALYQKLVNDDELCFVIAHEMAHYRNKDHLNILRKNIAGSVVILGLTILSPNDPSISNLVKEGFNITNLKYSRTKEAKADKYAAYIIKNIYGSTDSGIRVLNILGTVNSYNGDFWSTHPSVQKRIKALENY